jgi:hypothetical protein
MSRQRAFQLVSAAKAVGNIEAEMSTMVDKSGQDESNEPPGSHLPTTEKQVRPLARLSGEQRAEAWQAAVETAPGGKVAAEHVGVKAVRESHLYGGVVGGAGRLHIRLRSQDEASAARRIHTGVRCNTTALEDGGLVRRTYP